MKRLCTSEAVRPLFSKPRTTVLSACVGAFLVAAVPCAAGGSALDTAASSTDLTWAPATGTYRFGLLPFNALQRPDEWSLGAVTTVPQGSAALSYSYLGAGLRLTRPQLGEEDWEDAGSLHDVELDPWVGGCMSCPLWGSATLDLEVRLDPGRLPLIRHEALSYGPDTGLMLRIPW